MKLFVTVAFFLLLMFSAPLQAQSMRDLFLMLPDDATPYLNESGRKTLIKEGEYAITGKRDEDEIDYAIDTLTDNYLSYEYSPSDGKGINVTYSIKKFKMDENKYVLFFTKDGDAINNAYNYVFKAYNITGKSLTENGQHFVPENLSYSIFLKPDTPDSIRNILAKTAACVFDLDIQSPDRIDFRITVESTKDKIWLSGDTMEFQWNGQLFVNKITFRKDDE